MIDALAPAPGEMILEIGPGHGELTLSLAATSEKLGCKIIAIEKDRELAAALERTIAEKHFSNVTVIPGDALKFFSSPVMDVFSKESLTKKDSPEKENGPVQFKIIGNIPYYLSGRLLRIVSELDPKPTRCVFTVQKEVAQRITAKPGVMSRLGASVQFWAAPTIVGLVPKESFYPVPKVDSAIIMLDALQGKSGVDAGVGDEKYYKTVRAIFAQPRKTVLNNVAAALAPNTGSEKDHLADELRARNIDPQARPQDLSVDDIVAIAKALF